jgi:hypothetical protein
MIGWIIGAVAAGYVCNRINKLNNEHKRNEIYLRRENQYLRRENDHLRLTIKNHSNLLANYDRVNKYAKSCGYKGAVDFFYYLANYHDRRFEHFAKFLYWVNCVRNDIAHNGSIYEIDHNFMNKLKACVEICDNHRRLSYRSRLRLN